MVLYTQKLISHFFTPLTILSLVLCSACTLGPDFKRPQPFVGESYTTDNPVKVLASKSLASGTAQSLTLGKDIAGQWWTLFHSRELTALIELAITQNPDLKAAMAALTQAQEIAQSKQSALFPSVDASFSVLRQKTSGALFGNPGFSGSLFTLYNASIKVSYTLDVFGAIRRQIEGYEAQAEYQRFQLEAAFLTMASNIVTTVVQEASLREQIAATVELLKLQSEQLAMTEKQLAVGAASRLDVVAQQATLEQTRATLPPLQQQLEQMRHQLTVLVGDVPSRKITSEFSLSSLQLPKQLPLSLPSKLLEQRPDIRAKEALLHVASADIGVATAAMLPDFTVTANISNVATRLGNMFIPGSSIWNTGLNLLQPVFHGSQLIHEKRAVVAAYKQAGEQYRSTVLHALQDVADSLSALEFDAAELTAQNAAEKAAFETLEISRVQYRVGAVNYLSLISAETGYQQSRIGQIKARAARFADTAALFQALGGGWWNRDDLMAKKQGKY